jgi:hypothetical protein
MSLRRIFLLILAMGLMIQSCFCQESKNSGLRILFHGIIKDKDSFAPVRDAQISINKSFSAVSDTDGTFSINVYRNDTVVFKHLGYKSVSWFVGDTLKGNEFAAGIYLPADTVSIGEVIIVPRNNNLRYQIMNSPSKVPANMENARYNVAISAYQGRTTTGKLGDPASNYGLLRQQQKTNAQEKGGIPSSQMVGLSPLMLVQAAYLLLNGLPEKPGAMGKAISKEELDQIQKKYFEQESQKK